ncbi:hypothetical protein [Scytonema sp. NUACC26]|uniref:hypothetical protein n=1 Tax=Scytonema sp. NUACC26 TaxID=3140176 RepID=UPI0038B3701E
MLFILGKGAKLHSQQVLLSCVVEDSEKAKKRKTEWQPGSAQARFGVNHQIWWGCRN